MKHTQNKYDLVVVGGGHAGIEAALIAHKRGIKTLLVSMDKKSVGRTSCNPAVGGLAKGQMVKEVDVLGGIMGFFADLSTLQSKTLNKSKGRSVWSPRSQIDKNLYEKIAQKYIKEQGLKVLEGDCETAVGAISVINNENITLEGELFSLDGKERFYCKSSKDIKHAAELGIEIGENLKKQSKGSYKK